MRPRPVSPRRSPKRPLAAHEMVSMTSRPSGAIWAIVVAGGEARRFGRSKQFLDLGGINVLERSVRSARSVATHVVAVVPKDAIADERLHGGADIAVVGGEDRAASVRAGLAVIPDSAPIIIVHDAARPLASPALFGAVVLALGEGIDAAIPGVGVTDTIKRVVGARVVETIAREMLVAVQTPQAFRAGALRSAHAGGGSATDDAALVELNGGTVVVVPGEAHNIKLTEPSDVDIALRYLRETEQGAAS